MHLVLRGGVPIAGRELDPAPLSGQAVAAGDDELPQPIGPPSCCQGIVTGSFALD
jgi:hypothetical protein